MGRIFNIAGSCNAEDHYMLPATERVPGVMRLVADKAYFVVHAQRQCGKTTAFLQRVINGGGEIIREMALGKKAMDLGVLFRGAKYAVECKKVSFYEKSHEKAYDQVCGYMDRLGVGEGWIVVFDPDFAKPWENRIYSRDISWQGKTVHLIGC